MSPASQGVGEDNRRRHGRVRCSGLSCTFGDVLDISLGGARVLVRGRPSKDIGDVTLVGFAGRSENACTVRARILSMKETARGLFGTRREVRLGFESVTPEATAAIRGLARNHADTDWVEAA